MEKSINKILFFVVAIIVFCACSHQETDSTLDLAKREAAKFYSGKVSFITDSIPGISSPEAFHIYGNNKNLTIVASSSVGALYGAMALSRIKPAPEGIDTIETPFYKYRILNHWDNLDGTVERGYAGKSLWKWDELPDSLSPRYEEYALKCAEVGINGAVLNNVNASPNILSHDYLLKVKGLADFLRKYGVKTYLSVNFASPIVLDSLPTADPLIPEVSQWWKNKANEIYELIPDFGGFLVKANSEGQPGPGDYGRSHSEGANMIADALAPHSGIVMWRAFVYSPSSDDRAKQAYLEFKPLDGEFSDNVIVQVKNGPIDFQPHEPYSPLFGDMPETDMMAEFQITQEYLGHANHLAYLAPMWTEFFDNVDPSFIKGIAGVANIGDNKIMTGNPLADANRYAFGRLAWNPILSSEKIIDEWLENHLFENPDSTPHSIKRAVKDMFMESREVVVDYMMPLGLHHIFAGNHHYGPEPWYYVNGIREDWTPRYYHKANKKGIGFDRTSSGSDAVSQYPDSLQQIYGNIDICPENLLLWFHHVPWNHKMKSGNTLWEELCIRYQNGVERVDSWIPVWDSVQYYINPEIYNDVKSRLETQQKDARWWRDACLLYFKQFSGLPFPKNYPQSKFSLDKYMEIKLPITNFENPSGELLDLYR